MTDIFEEVDESLRQDKAGELWKKYSPFVYGAIVIAILGVAGNEFLKWQRSGEIEKSAKVYDVGALAMEKKDFNGARTAFNQIKNDNTGFSKLAGHMLAGIDKQLTNDPAAIAKDLSDAAAKDPGGVLGDIATLKLAYAKADTGTLQDLQTIVKPLVDRGGYAASLAKEVVAAKKLAGGDVEGARQDYQALSLEIEAPQSLKVRVTQVLQTLPPAPAAPAAAATPAPAQPVAPAPAAPAPAKPAQ
ncbi:MAG TPA: tetratricopeptide repeat protein [Hyphomonadaceae bacterium]|nr:tetratricopeptide repeat protein [Hyphomonadaceae bacterium]